MPATTDEAIDFMTAVSEQPGYTTVPGDAGVLSTWWRVCGVSQVCGDLLPMPTLQRSVNASERQS